MCLFLGAPSGIRTRDPMHTASAVSCQLGDIRRDFVKHLNFRIAKTRAANSESVATLFVPSFVRSAKRKKCVYSLVHLQGFEPGTH